MGKIQENRIKDIQKSLQSLNSLQSDENKIDGWLFYDFHNRDPLAYRILLLDEQAFHSRRWYYFIPTNGSPQKVVSSVEPNVLNELPGKKNIYLSLQQKKDFFSKILSSNKNILMNYSPMNDVPYVSMVDAGTFEFIQNFGCSIRSAQELIQKFEGLVDNQAFKTHKEAGKIMHEIMQKSFSEISRRLREGISCREIDIKKFIQQQYAENNLISDGSPEVAINKNAADPHYFPTEESPSMKEGDLVLIDSWAKLNKPGSVYYDFTWMAYIGREIPERIQNVWNIVRSARDAAIEFERKKLSSGEPCYGFEVDNVCRKVIDDAGFGKFFLHRTGHSIGQEVHGNAVNIDGLETRDTRQIQPGVLHSVEPGIYLAKEGIGIRSEVDVYVDKDRNVKVTGPIQQEIVKIQP
ncbi:MAG: M24 family metallopeptidase [Promethearchaeota archaeon]